MSPSQKNKCGIKSTLKKIQSPYKIGKEQFRKYKHIRYFQIDWSL